jgi:hypothetical protein
VWRPENTTALCQSRYPVVTNEEGHATAAMMVWRLQHADMENALKEHKSGFGLEKLPTQKFHA